MIVRLRKGAILTTPANWSGVIVRMRRGAIVITLASRKPTVDPPRGSSAPAQRQSLTAPTNRKSIDVLNLGTGKQQVTRTSGITKFIVK